MFIPTKTLFSILISELWLRSNMLRLIKCPKVPSFNLEMELEAKFTSDSLGDVSNKWTPTVGIPFRERSRLSRAGRLKADWATV